MLELITLGVLIIVGIGLILAEVIFVPGTTFVGVLGFLCLIAGVYTSYSMFGTMIGHAVFASSGIVLVLAVAYSLKTQSWKKFSLEDSITSKVNEDEEIEVFVGDVALTISALRPVGTVEYNNQQFEVTTLGEFVDTDKPVKIIKVNNKEIIVEPITPKLEES